MLIFMSLSLPSPCDDTVLRVAADIEAPFSRDSHSNVNCEPPEGLAIETVSEDAARLAQVKRVLFDLLLLSGQEARFLVYRYLWLAARRRLQALIGGFNKLPPGFDDEDPLDAGDGEEARIRKALTRLTPVMQGIESIATLLPSV